MSQSWDWGIKCRSCTVFFHLVVDHELDFSELHCVECKSDDLQLESYQENTDAAVVEMALLDVVDKVQLLAEKIKALEEHLEIQILEKEPIEH